MNTIICTGAKGCTAYFATTEPLHRDVRYTCREHTPKGSDKVRFQANQFDKDLTRAGTPIGTAHIPGRQGAAQPTGLRPASSVLEEEEDD
jgi:hypothetical protein